MRNRKAGGLRALTLVRMATLRASSFPHSPEPASALRAVRSATHGVMVNRAPVLTLWAAIVAERLGFKREEALTMGRAVAGLNAYARGVALGLFKPAPAVAREERERLAPGGIVHVALLHRAVPTIRRPDGLRALSHQRPVDPAAVQHYLESKFGSALSEVEVAMRALAASLPVDELARRAYDLYEVFRPAVPRGTRGWGAAGVLDLARIREAARIDRAETSDIA